MREVKTLLLEKVQATKVTLIDNYVYKLEFTEENKQQYIVFITKMSVDNNLIKLDDYFDVVKIDRYRESDEDAVSIFKTSSSLTYEGIYSIIRIEPNHTDPAKFNRIG